MKKALFSSILVIGLTAQASIFDFFDFTKLFEGAIVIAEGINENLEKLRLKQLEFMNISEQWNAACEVTSQINPNLQALHKLLSDHKVNQEVCAPVTTVLKLQMDLLKKCSDYYSKPVPDNAEYMVQKFTLSIMQTRMLLNKCYPALATIKIPGLPGGGGNAGGDSPGGSDTPAPTPATP